MFPLHAPHFILYSLSNTPQQLSSKFTRCVCVRVCATCIDIYLFWVFHFVILCCLLWFGALVRFDFGMCVSCCLIPWCKLRSSTLFAYYTFYNFPFYHTVLLAFFSRFPSLLCAIITMQVYVWHSAKDIDAAVCQVNICFTCRKYYAKASSEYLVVYLHFGCFHICLWGISFLFSGHVPYAASLL